jgi:glycosyltransferase involved in cell wall biosynthesis
MNDLMLSIYIPTYNHEKYIAQALDGILMQKTKYSYEVLIGEDCSPDGTRNILKEYEKKYPEKFQMFYREHNMNGKVPNNAGDLKRRCKGKYIIGLEGDDYWTDENKLEKQISFLESHPDYLAVAHNCVVVDANSMPNGEQYPECKDEEYTLKHFVSEIMPGQLTTIMYRNYMRGDVIDTSLFQKGLRPGDRLNYFALASNGKIHCIQKVMSAYRHIKNEGTSYSAIHKYDFEKSEQWNLGLVEYAKVINNKQAQKYAEMLYFRNLMNGYSAKQCNVKEFFDSMKKLDYRAGTVILYARYWINHHIFHKKIWI